jgi:hypothetical protein
MVRSEVDTYTVADSAPRWKKRMTDFGTGVDAPPVPSVLGCAQKLRGILEKFQHERAETGECKDFIKHELQWAEWFVEASRVGVLHLKVSGCRCRPEWEELGNEEKAVV